MWYEHRHDLYQSFVFTIVISGILAIPILMFNLTVFITIWRTYSLHTTSNIFLCSLAVSDFLFALLGIPLSISWLSSHFFSTNLSVICSLSYASTILGSFFGMVSYGTLTAATVDRYLALKLHLSYHCFVTPRRVFYTCGGIWLFSLVISLTILSSVSAYCWAVSPTVLICTIIMAFCYYKIFLILRRHRNQIHNCQALPDPNHCWNTSQFQNQNAPNLFKFRKSIFVVLYVFALCVLLYTPYISALVVFEFVGRSLSLLKFWIISTALVYTNSALNPFIYCWRIVEIRNAIKEKFNKSSQ